MEQGVLEQGVLEQGVLEQAGTDGGIAMRELESVDAMLRHALPAVLPQRFATPSHERSVRPNPR